MAYRELLSLALPAVHDLTGDCDCLREQLARLRDEYRHLREQIVNAEAA